MEDRLTKKRRTRHRLTQALLVTIQRHGFRSLTTGRVASRAGFAQPTFYVHFRNMDEALEQLASSVVGRIETALATDSSMSDEHPTAALQHAVSRCARALVADEIIADVFLRCRRDRHTPLGQAWTLQLMRVHERMRELVYRIGPSIPLPIATLHAEMLVGIILALTEGTLDGRIEDLDRATAVAARAVAASVLSEHTTADAA